METYETYLSKNTENNSNDTRKEYDTESHTPTIEHLPKISMSSFVSYQKEKSVIKICDEHASLKYKFVKRHFCAEGFYTSTAILNEVTKSSIYKIKNEKV